MMQRSLFVIPMIVQTVCAGIFLFGLFIVGEFFVQGSFSPFLNLAEAGFLLWLGVSIAALCLPRGESWSKVIGSALYILTGMGIGIGMLGIAVYSEGKRGVMLLGIAGVLGVLGIVALFKKNPQA